MSDRTSPDKAALDPVGLDAAMVAWMETATNQPTRLRPSTEAAIRAYLATLPPQPVSAGEAGAVAVPAAKLLAIRDALVAGDINEASHQLYAIANPTFDSRTPWADLEARALIPEPKP